jgi:hypothetical protein
MERLGMSALCQKQTYAAQQKVPIRSPLRRFGLRKQRRWYRETDRLGLSGEVASISSENTQPFPSQKNPMPNEPLATYNRQSTYLIQVRETRVLLATFPRVLLAVLQYLAA